MRYYRDVDYFLCFEDFPRMGVPGAIGPNLDGTCCIYINTLYCEKKQRETLHHELRHMALWHLWRDDMELRDKETEADALQDGRVIIAPDYSWVETTVG